MKIDFGNKFTVIKSGFFQYDHGQSIEVYGIGLTGGYLSFQFHQNGQPRTQLGTYDGENNCYIANVPDEFLQNAEDILCYIYNDSETTGKTEKIIVLHITPREKPEDIPSEETKSIIGEILDKLYELEEFVTNFKLTDEQLESILEQVKAELGEDVATKEDLEALNNIFATKEEMQQMSNAMGQSTSALGTAIGNNTAKISTLETEIGKIKAEVGTINAELEEI